MDKERFKKLRKEKGFTQRRLAEKLDLSPSTIAMYETGERKPDSNKLKKISRIFGVSTDFLLGNTDERHTAESIKKQYEDENVDVEELFERFNVQLNGQDLDEKEWKAVIETLRNLRKAGEEGANNE